MLPQVPVQCEARSVIIREVYGMRVLENRILKKIFGAKGDEK